MAGSEANDLLERLVADPAFRARFEVDPSGTARDAGFHALAAELALDDGSPMQTLELRESRSSLAGALMAAAAEGLGLFEIGGHLFGAEDAHAAVTPSQAASGNGPTPLDQPVEPVADSPATRLAARAAQVAEQQHAVAAPAEPPAAAHAAAASPAGNPDDLTGNADDEDAGADEEDGSDENEPDEGGSDDSGGDDSQSDDSSDDSGDDSADSGDDDSDAPGEGSNGEDATDDNAGDSSSGDSSDSSDSSDSDSSDSSDSSSDGVASGAAADLAASGTYPGDGAPREQIAAWMSAAAEKRGLPPDLPVMASLVEAGLRNLDHGDADSLGFFQMRTSVWDEGPYKGYAGRPELQVQWFLDRAEAVKQQRLAAGLSVDDPHQYGDWIADVERPAEQYRGRYQLRLDEARALLEQAAAKPRATATSTGNDALVLPAVDASDAVAATGLRAAIVETAKSQLGIPYQWGGEAKLGSSTDCSGLLQAVLAKHGVQIPRVTYDQFKAGVPVDINQVKPGDAVFFDESRRGPEHVGIYIGGGSFIEDPHTGASVRIADLKSRGGFVGARRYIGT
jgi:cell wall-associated NlpC family hydrolase